MIAAAEPHLLRRPADVGPLAMAAVTPSRAGAVLAFGLGFLAFMPYPAIPAGKNSAVQFGNILTILMVLPTLALTWRRRPFQYFPVLLAPLVLSTLKVGVFGGDVLLSLKALAVWGVSGLAMVATQLYAPRYGRQLMSGIAAATLVHSAVGLWQLYAFGHGELPLLELYVNPSFLGVQDRAHVIATYIQRPFGLFPEPSAMSSSLAPWVLLWLAETFGLVRFPGRSLSRHRVLFFSAAAGGLLLIVLSRSGHAMVTVAGALLLFGMWVKSASSSVRSYATLVLVVRSQDLGAWMRTKMREEVTLNEEVVKATGRLARFCEMQSLLLMSVDDVIESPTMETLDRSVVDFADFLRFDVMGGVE